MNTPHSTPINVRHLIVVMALAMESRGHIEALAKKYGFHLLYTGVGKVNAAMHLAHELGRRHGAGASHPAALVINIGTAGSHHYSAHTLLNPIRFYQHDMRVEALGFATGQTPFEADSPLVYGETLATLAPDPNLATIRTTDCYTGDSFITDPTLDYPVMDMEAYALAKTCQHFALRFCCLKFITDGADHNAAESWDEKLDYASQALSHALQALLESCSNNTALAI